MQSLCYYCHHLRTPKLVTKIFAAKFKLVYAGLIVEAAELDDYIAARAKVSTTSGDQDEETEEKLVVQANASPEELMDDIDTHVEQCILNRHESSYQRPKSILITDCIRKLERQFLASIPTAACGNCRGQSPKFRKEGQHKIFVKGFLNV